jgi:hypothetical protein
MKKLIDIVLNISSGWFKFLNYLVLVTGIFIIYVKMGQNIYIKTLLLTSMSAFLLFITAFIWKIIYFEMKMTKWIYAPIYILIPIAVIWLFTVVEKPLITTIATLATPSLMK